MSRCTRNKDQSAGVDAHPLHIMTMMRIALVLSAACCLLSVCAQDQLVKVSLDKRPLSLDQLPSPHRRAEQLGLLQSADGGEDIPILNFLDAQVRVRSACFHFFAKLLGKSDSIGFLFKCSIMERSAWEALRRTSWLSSTPAARTFGCPLLSAAGSASLVIYTTSIMLPTLPRTR